MREPFLPWLQPDEPFPSAQSAWGPDTPAPGLVCAGADLSVTRLRQAYGSGLFPWFSPGQPILWWSPAPRMVLPCANFKLRPSLRKTLRRFARDPGCQIRVDHAFEAVITACAQAPREGQSGTWIGPDMIQAYVALHAAGYAHSVETWMGGELVGGLYLVAIGRAVFGESMFHRATDASKIALAALVAYARLEGVVWIDCQQVTDHLASLGASPQSRTQFLQNLALAQTQPPLDWCWSVQTATAAWQCLGLNV